MKKIFLVAVLLASGMTVLSSGGGHRDGVMGLGNFMQSYGDYNPLAAPGNQDMEVSDLPLDIDFLDPQLQERYCHVKEVNRALRQYRSVTASSDVLKKEPSLYEKTLGYDPEDNHAEIEAADRLIEEARAKLCSYFIPNSTDPDFFKLRQIFWQLSGGRERVKHMQLKLSQLETGFASGFPASDFCDNCSDLSQGGLEKLKVLVKKDIAKFKGQVQMSQALILSQLKL